MAKVDMKRRGGAVPSWMERKWSSWLAPTLILTCLAVFIITMFVNNCSANLGGQCVGRRVLVRFSFQPFKENPSLGPSLVTLRKMGALHWEDIVNRGQGWRLVTSIWLHAGFVHLALNLFTLMFIAIPFEQEFGFLKTGIIYLMSGFGGSVLSTIFFRDEVSVCASGPLFGFLGAMLADLIINRTMYTSKAAALLMLLVIFVINLPVAILPYVNNFAHIGGFLTGFLLGFILLHRTRGKPDHQCILRMIVIILLMFGLFIALVMLFQGVDGNHLCHWCHYLACIPTSKWRCYQGWTRGLAAVPGA